jgi:hypothetical protein
MAAPKSEASETSVPEVGRRPTEPPARTGVPIAEHQATVAQEVMQRYKQAARAPGVKFVMPGGQIHDATPYLQSRHRQLDHSAQFGQIAKWLTEEWVADHPGYEYAWPKYDDKMLSAHIRQEDYAYVPASALRKDCPLGYTVFTSPKGDEGIQILDVVCVAVSPPVYERLFRAKEAMGVAAVVGNMETFYAGVDAEGGRADTWVEHSPR